MAVSVPASERGRERVHPLVQGAFYAFMFSIPLEHPDRTIPLEVHTVTACVLLMVAALQPKACFRRPHAAFWWLAGFLWLYVARGLFSDHAAEAAKLLGNFVLVGFVFWVAQNLLEYDSVSRRALGSFAAGCAVIAVLQVLGIATSTVIESTGGIRTTVFDQDENLLGANMALALIAVIGLGLQRHGRDRPTGRAAFVLLAGAPVLLLGDGLLMSGSRGAALAAFAGLLMLPLQHGRGLLMARRVAVGGSAALALAWFVVTATPLASRFTMAEAGNLAGREHLYPEAWAMFLERPVLGWGPVDNAYELGMRTASFAIGGERDQQIRKDPHDLLLDLLTETGIVGTVPALMCLLLCVAAAWRGRASPAGTVPLALMAASLVVSLDVNWLATKQLWLVCAYAVAAGRVARRRGGEHAGAVCGVPVSHVLGDLHRPRDAGADRSRDRRPHPVAQAPATVARTV